MPTALILGAGLAGLTAARELTRAGWNVTVVDKGRGVGGRLATRRLENARADHGAQYFTVRTPEFQQVVSEMLGHQIIRKWYLPDSAHPRYVGLGGMSSVAKYLAKDLPVVTGERIVRLSQTNGRVVAESEKGTAYRADAVLITAPAPQALALLADSGLSVPEAESALNQIHFEPCIATMVLLREPVSLPEPGAMRFTEGPIAWVADNQQKGVSPDQPSLTIHATPAFSREHLEEDMAAVGDQLIRQLSEILSPENIQQQQTHRWRYALASQRFPEPCLLVKTPFPMVFGGDGFGPRGNVEGAFLSGLAMSERIKN
ncbi:NAD(P)/FAD-dependent oxidoreductase [Tellurirhabdus rosea]|uniref:NAD(P)/FAD-dependent oxidoreductase n=1 Tax=Tellurirhabdus rosea TaxID=2674997 RepID=UPI00224C94F7|nr:FAD-dependent oxidoreductase [Tellurirhabdus rosea]